MEFLNINTAKNIAIGVNMPSVKTILDTIQKEAYNGAFNLTINYWLTNEQITCLEHLGFKVSNDGFDEASAFCRIKWN